jgi:tetratricopeptide (TPR) repeat protein
MPKPIRLLFLFALIAAVAMSGTGCSKQAKAARSMERAERYFAAGDYDKAEIEYENALRADYKHPPPLAFERLGAIAFEQGRLRFAYPLILAARADTNNLDFRVKLALFYLVAGKQKEARDEAIFVLDHRPDDPQAPLILVDGSFTTKEIDAASQRLQKLSVPPARRAPIEVALANLAMRQHDMKAALDALGRARLADPKFVPLYSSLGFYYFFQNDWKRADEAFKMAVDNAPARSPIRLRYAQFKVQTGDVAGARKILQDALAKAPDFVSAMQTLADIDAGENKYDEASAWLAKILGRDPGNYDALFLSGRIRMAQGKPALAAAEFEKLTQANPKAYLGFYELGVAYRDAHDNSKAINALNQTLALQPDFVACILALDQIKIAKGDLNSAIVSLRQVTAKNPQLIPAQLLLAEAYQNQRNFSDAARIYRGIEDAYPTNSQTPMLLGNVLLQEDRRREARAEFNKSFVLAPDNFSALDQLTSLDIADRQFAAATQRAQQTMAKAPNAPEPGLSLARIQLAQGNSNQAVATINQTIDAHPDFVPAYIMLGNLYSTNNQPKAAQDVARKLLARSPGQPGGLMLLATSADALKDFPTARDGYEKVLSLDPHNSSALNNLAYLYSQHDQLDKAYELARRARELKPTDPSTADTFGWICYGKGDYDQALTLIQESAASPLASVPEVQLHLGMVRYITGDEDGARRSLQYAAQSKDDFPAKDEAAQCLAIMAIDPANPSPDARDVLEKRLAARPGDTGVLLRLAEIYQRSGNADKAIVAYEAALKSYPKHVRALTQLAQLYATKPGQTERALNFAKTAAKLAPDNVDASRLLGRLAYATGDYKLSLSVRQELFNKRPLPENRFDLAESAYSVGRVDEAVAETQTALQSGASFPRAADARRFAQFAPLAGNPAAAAAASAQINEALKADPVYVPALMALGATQEQKPDVASAKQTYEKVLARFPDFIPAKKHLAILYAQEPGDDRRAYDLAIKAREALPDDPDVARALGIITCRQGDYARSEKFLKESAAKKGSDAQSAYYLGIAQYNLHEKDDSKKNLILALNSKLPDNHAAEAKRILAELK